MDNFSSIDGNTEISDEIYAQIEKITGIKEQLNPYLTLSLSKTLDPFLLYIVNPDPNLNPYKLNQKLNETLERLMREFESGDIKEQMERYNKAFTYREERNSRISSEPMELEEDLNNYHKNHEYLQVLKVETSYLFAITVARDVEELKIKWNQLFEGLYTGEKISISAIHQKFSDLYPRITQDNVRYHIIRIVNDALNLNYDMHQDTLEKIL